MNQKIEKGHNRTTMTTAIIFFIAIIIRQLDPLTLKFSPMLWEVVAAITLVCIWVYGKRKQIFTKQKNTKSELFCFGIFSLFVTLSYIYWPCNSLHDANLAMGIYCLISLPTNFFLAKYGYQVLQHFLVNTKEKPLKTNFLARQIAANNFWFYFAVLFICYLAWLIINYPGALMYDPMVQIMQIYKIPNITTSQVNLIDPNQFITTHHPFAHTMLIKFTLTIGEWMGSLDAGMFIYGLLQITMMALGIAYLLKYAHKFFTNRWMLAWLLIFSLNPIILMYSALMTKDTLFAVFFALFALKFYEYIQDNTITKNKAWAISFIAITLLCSLFRNNFFYAALLSFIILLIVKKDKRFFAIFAIYMCIYCAYTYVLVPGLGVTNGSIREVISVPFQQTANYAKYYEVTAEEKEAISKILDFEHSKEYYRPDVSNPVKNTYNKDATTKDLVDYFVTWGKMFFKHPLAYFDAYFNQFYGYFSPKIYYTTHYALDPTLDARAELIENGIAISETMPFMPVKEAVDLIMIAASVVPVVYLINNAGIYIWIILTAIALLCKKQKKHLVWLYLPFLLYFATLLISPANATLEYRYMFPYLIAMPILIAPIRETRQQTLASEETENA